MPKRYASYSFDRHLHGTRKIRPPAPAPVSNPNGFPKPMKIIYTHYNGLPLMTSPGVFDSSIVAAMSKFPYITIEMVPFTQASLPSAWGLVGLVKARNPNCKVLWYSLLTNKLKNTSVPANLAGAEWAAAEAALAPYYEIGPPPDTAWFPDGQAAGTDGTAVFCDLSKFQTDLFNILVAHQARPNPRADGLYFDYAVGKPAGWNAAAPNPTSIDFAKAGYGSAAALNSSNQTALDTLLVALKAYGEVQGNRGSSFFTDNTVAYHWDGEVFELWDPLTGITGSQGVPYRPNGYPDFDTAMTEVLAWETRTSPSDSNSWILVTKPVGNGPNYGQSTEWNKTMRFGLASATVCGAYGGIMPSGAFLDVVPFYANDWADEYSVDTAGSADVTGANMGWLGRPTETGYKDATSGLWVRHFEHGVVLANGGVYQNRSITLEKTYKRISGVYDTAVNNGASGTSFTLPGQSGLFLINP